MPLPDWASVGREVGGSGRGPTRCGVFGSGSRARIARSVSDNLDRAREPYAFTATPDGARGCVCVFEVRKWSHRQASNPRTAAYKAAALPSELRWPRWLSCRCPSRADSTTGALRGGSEIAPASSVVAHSLDRFELAALSRQPFPEGLPSCPAGLSAVCYSGD